MDVASIKCTVTGISVTGIWQGRFGSVVMDEPHALAALRYICFNPVRAGLVAQPQDWLWSSVHAHLHQTHDGLTTIAPMQERVGDFAALLSQPPSDETILRLRQAESIGRPLGDDAFMTHLECQSGRLLRPAKRGPKPKSRDISINDN